MPDSEAARRAEATHFCIHMVQLAQNNDQEHLANDILVLTDQERADCLIVLLGMIVTGIKQLKLYSNISYN
jgi:hypothetical protein